MIWLLCGYIWLYIHRPFEVWAVLGTLRIERIYMLTVLGVWLCSHHKRLLPNRLNGTFAFLAVVLVTAWVLSPLPLETRPIEDFFKVGVFFVLLMTTVRNEQQLRTIIAAFLGAMALYMLHSLWEYQNGRHAWRMETHRMIGVDAFYNDPNSFAATLLYALPMLLPFWTRDTRLRNKLLVGGYAVLTVTCILLTGSRTGFVGLLCLGTVIGLFLSRRRMRVIVCMTVLAAVAWTMLPEDRKNRYLTIVDASRGPASAQASAVSRQEFLKIAVRLWRDHPVLGLGPGGFQIASGTGMQPHNLYGQVLSELGTLGAAAFLFLLVAFHRNAKEMRQLKQQYPELSESFAFRVSCAVSITVLLLLLVGLAGHNLLRYTWMWVGAFQAIALHVATLQVRDYCAYLDGVAAPTYAADDLAVAWNA